MDPTAIEFTRSVLLVLGGALGVEIFKAIRDGITGSMKRRRAEVDRIAREKAAREDDNHRLEADLHEEETWARIVTEHAHAVRVIAIQAGQPVPDFPLRPPTRSTS